MPAGEVPTTAADEDEDDSNQRELTLITMFTAQVTRTMTKDRASGAIKNIRTPMTLRLAHLMILNEGKEIMAIVIAASRTKFDKRDDDRDASSASSSSSSGRHRRSFAVIANVRVFTIYIDAIITRSVNVIANDRDHEHAHNRDHGRPM